MWKNLLKMENKHPRTKCEINKNMRAMHEICSKPPIKKPQENRVKFVQS